MKQRGVTLVELVVSISVIAIAGVSLMSTLSYLSGAGSDHVLQAQAQSIANAYLNEILGKRFADPDVDGEGDRCQFDDVDDYQGLDTATASDECGLAAGNFRVRVALTPGTLGTLPASAVWRIDVTVDYGVNERAIATGYRTNHP
jgi:MSHA pilin protein MshD